MNRKILIAGGAVIAAIVIILGILLATLNVNQFRGTIETSLEQELHRSVAMGNMSLGLFPLAIRVNNVQIGENPGFATGRPFVAVNEIRVRCALLPLLRREVRVSSLELEKPSIELVRNAAGQWNYSDLLGQQSGGSGSGSSSLEISTLRIVDGSVTMADLSKPGSTAAYDHINVDLTDFAPGKTFHVKASAELPGAKADSFVLEGSGMPFNGHVSINGAPAAALAKFAGAGIPVDGVLSGSADVQSANSVTTAKGSLSLDRATVHGAPLGVPIRVDFDVASDSRADTTTVRSAKITAGSVVVTATARMNSKNDTVTASAETANANVTHLLALARALGAGNATGSGTLSFNVTASGPLKGELNYSGSATVPDARISSGQSSGPVTIHNASVRFNGSTAEIGAGNLSSGGLALTNLQTTAAFNKGVVTLSPLSAGVFGGTASGTISVDTRQDPQAMTANVKVAGADANQLLSATTSLKNTMYGSLSAATNLKLRLYSAAEAMTRSMNGSLGINLVNGRLGTVNTMNELASIGKFVGYSFNPQTSTVIRKLSGNLAITNGVAQTNNLEMQMEGGSLAAAGVINLVDQTLNLKVTAVVDRSTSQQAGGNRIGGFMQTALLNSGGELVIPATVTGTFAHPRFAPDLEQMAAMRLKRLLPTSAAPGKALLGLFGGGGNQQGQQPSVQNAVGGVLNSIFGGKKKTQ